MLMSIWSYPLVWMPLSEEISPFTKYCKGLVLNAGSGERKLNLGEKELRLDIVAYNRPDIIADLHHIPLQDNTVDTIVSIAVLEHTCYPWLVIQEFYRVLKPGCYGVIAVPFLQPQHNFPGDYVRFTENGLVELVKQAGFEVVETAHVHHFGQTIAWLLFEYIQYNKPPKIIWFLWMILLRQLSKGRLFKGDSPNTHNTHYVIVSKPGVFVENKPDKSTIIIDNNLKNWFYPLLACPKTRQALYFTNNFFASEDGCSIYSFENDIPRLLPY